MESNEKTMGVATEPNHVEVGEAFGLHWINGHEWGVAHPEANCYADDGCTRILDGGGRMAFDVALRPREHHGRVYPWAVGLVRSREAVGYGRLTVDFLLPQGSHLQPAVWLYDAQSWPPEIDVVEGWSMSARWWMPRGWLYRRSLLTDKVHPSLIVADGAAGGVRALRGGCPRAALWHGLLDVGGRNRAEMVWTPDRLDVSYNGRRVMHATAARHPMYFARLNECRAMNIFLNTYTTARFSYDDYTELGRPLVVLDLKHTAL